MNYTGIILIGCGLLAMASAATAETAKAGKPRVRKIDDFSDGGKHRPPPLPVDFERPSALFLAVGKKDLKRAQGLLEAGANPNTLYLGKTGPLMVAVLTGQVDMVRLLLRHGADVNLGDPQNGVTPLMAVSTQDNSPMLKVLLEKGAGVNRANAEGMTALHYAYLGNAGQNITLLVAQGANASSRDNDGRTPREMAGVLKSRGQLKEKP